MKGMTNLSRRALMRGAAAASFVATGIGSASRTAAQPASTKGNALVAYFSRTGNTRLVAQRIARARGVQLFEIRPAEPYPDDYEATVAQATRERESGIEPPLAETAGDLRGYDTLYLGFPIWGMTAPPIIRSFLSNHDLADKTLVPLVTHGGYGLGSSLDVVAAHAPHVRLVEGFTMEGEQERRVLERVNGWLEGLRTEP